MSPDTLLGMLGLTAVFAPVVAALGLVIPWALGGPWSEHAVRRIIGTTFVVDLLGCIGLDVLLLLHGGESHTVTLTHWLVVPSYVVDARLVFDAASALMMTLTALLCGLIGAFSAPYLHQDSGFYRFFVLLPLFAAGMMAVAAGDTLDLVYAGWEVVGISSALLIAYFHTREAPVRHGLRAFAVYRVCDVALLTAAVMLHHFAGDASLGEVPVLEPGVGLTIALLLVFASMGKSAAFPFTGWLPRAMEGPTPSSAIFYGALSIHAGPFLLIRAWPILEGQPIARVALFCVGLVTALHASMVGRVQTDIKTSLGYASVTQAALILMEVSLGFTQLALLHIAGHAVLRTWQLLRAPSLLHDWHQITGLIGGSRPGRGAVWERLLPEGLRRWAYRVALERWFLDDLAAHRLLGPLVWMLRSLDALDQRWTGWLAGEPAEELRAETRWSGATSKPSTVEGGAK